jgi:hypothetical protein
MKLAHPTAAVQLSTVRPELVEGLWVRPLRQAQGERDFLTKQTVLDLMPNFNCNVG